MRPLMLTMQAFGTYVEKTTVDFTPLHQKLFLITGATGGGKTTILDAICFALYCRATGGRRTWSDMRSIAADFQTPTLVDFSFALGEERYRFTRSLRLHKVRGTERIEQRDEHSCWVWKHGDWELLVSGAESRVREQAQRLLGLTCEQFSQVIVLPQGEFRKLLLSNSSEKVRIFQTLFQTERWEKLSKKVQFLADELRREADKLFEARKAILTQEDAENVQQLAQALESAQKEETARQTEAEQLSQAALAAAQALVEGRALQERFEKLAQARQREKELRAKCEEMQVQKNRLLTARRAQEVWPFEQDCSKKEALYGKKQAQLNNARQHLEQERQSLQLAQEAAAAVPRLRAQATQLGEQAALESKALQNAAGIEDIARAVAGEQQEEKAVQAALQQAAQAHQQATQNIEKGEAYVAQVDSSAARLPTLTARQAQLGQMQEQFHKWANWQQAYQQAGAQWEQAQRQAQRTAVGLQAQRAQLNQEEQLRNQDMAGLLAASLREGQPCPVCGAVHHPNPAQPAEGMPAVREEDRLEFLRDNIKQEEQRLLQQQGEAAQKEAVLRSSKQEMEKAEQICRACGLSAQQVQEELAANKEELTKAQEAAGKLDRARKLLQQRKQEAATAAEQVEKHRETLLLCRQRLAQLQAQLQAARKQLPEDVSQLPLEKALQTLRERVASLKQRAQEQEEQAGALEKAYHAASNRVASSAAALASCEAEEKEAAANWKEARRILQERLGQAGFGPNESVQAFLLPPETIRQQEQEITDFENQLTLAQTHLAEQEQVLLGVTPPDIAALKQRQAERQEQAQQAQAQLGALQQRNQRTTALLKELNKLEQQAGEIERRYAAAARVAQLVGGNNAAKVPLRMFVLGIMLDDILTRANLYFSTLSQGRYRLERKTESGGKRGYGGLDIVVFDAYCGGVRPVDTLSGGELFLASLSLAFGLSDVVQSHSGGVRLDSLFIDEGFGSLDADTLEIAMRALSQVQQMGRTVGIISHVAELKSRIGYQIVVSRSGFGSRLRLVTP